MHWMRTPAALIASGDNRAFAVLMPVSLGMVVTPREDICDVIHTHLLQPQRLPQEYTDACGQELPQ